MNEPVYPIVAREEIEDGYIIRWDYGPKQGVTTGIVHRVKPDPEQRERTIRNINQLIAPYGYELAN